MPKFLTDEEFMRIVSEDFDSLMVRQYDIIIRPENKREYAASRTQPYSEGGRDARGDIVVYSSPHANGIRTNIGARFDLPDPVESLLRKMAFDKVMGYLNSYTISDGGSVGSVYGFDAKTPVLVSTSFSSDGTTDDAGFRERFLLDYGRAKEYLRIIDSPFFEELVETTQQAIDEGLQRVVSEHEIEL